MHLGDHGDRRAGVDEDEVADRDGCDERRVDRLGTGGRADARQTVGFDRQHLGRPSLVGAGDADRRGVVGGRLDHARVFEADVGELPQQVVQPDDRAVVAGGAGLGPVSPQHVMGDSGGWARAGADPDGRQPPGLGTAQQGGGTGRVGAAEERQHVPGRRHGPQRGDRIRRVDRDGGQGPLADDHRVDELDGDVASVLRPVRRDAPHRRPGGELPGEVEGG